MIIILYDNDCSIIMIMSAFAALPFSQSALIFQGGFSPFHRRTHQGAEGQSHAQESWI